MQMGPILQKCMKQNGTTDIYEAYFEDVEEDHSSTPPSAKVWHDISAHRYALPRLAALRWR
jgi:hypothetical protein